MFTKRPLFAVVVSVASLLAASACSKKGASPESESAPSPLASTGTTVTAEPDQEIAEPTLPPPVEDKPAPTPLTDAQIAKVIDAVDAGEIEQAKVAQKKSKNPKVKKYAQQVIQQHTKSKQKSSKVTKKAKITPEDNALAAQLSGKATEQLEELKNADVASIDVIYLEGQAQQHREVLELVEVQLMPGATSDDVKTLLNDLKSMATTHESRVKELQASLASAPQN